MAAVGSFSDHLARLYQHSLTISREPAVAVNGRGGPITQSAVESLPKGTLFALRYGKFCDSAHLIFMILPRGAGANGREFRHGRELRHGNR